MSIGKLESFLGRHIEGFFNNKFSSELEFAEIVKQLEREVLHRRKRSNGQFIVPNVYNIELNIEDYQRLCVRRYMEEMHVAVEKAIIANDCFVDGNLSINMNGSVVQKKGICRVQSHYADDIYDRVKGENKDFKDNSTLVLNKKDFKPPLNLPEEYRLVSLLAVEGPDIDSYLEFGEKQIYIGRRVKNDFILTDANASRVHAYITYERHRHVLYDADSLNGTYVNKSPINGGVVLKPGDEITIGSSIIVYDLI